MAGAGLDCHGGCSFCHCPCRFGHLILLIFFLGASQKCQYTRTNPFLCVIMNDRPLFLPQAARKGEMSGSERVKAVHRELTEGSASLGYLPRSLRRIPPAIARTRIAPMIHGHGVDLVSATVVRRDTTGLDC